VEMTLSPAAVAADGERIIKTTHRHRHQRLHRRHRRPIVTSTVISAWRAVWVCFLLSSFHRFVVAFRCTNARIRFRKSSPRKNDNIPSMHSIKMIEHIDPIARFDFSVNCERKGGNHWDKTMTMDRLHKIEEKSHMIWAADSSNVSEL